MFKIGIGYDVHKLVTKRELILGGVTIPYGKGLLGHSDADVLVHAVMDALLGAAGLGDIGRHFPDTASEYEGISSILLLKEVKNLLDAEKYEISNVDSIIITQKPKLAPYIKQMENNLTECLKCAVNVKATTEEELGFTGAGEGIAAKAVALIYANKPQLRML